MHACATSQSWQSVLNLMTFMQTLGLDEISKCGQLKVFS